MSTTQEESLFPLGTKLADASLEQRLSAVRDLIAAGEVPVAEREELLLLALNPSVWGAE